jgi:rod shape-determining protein MreD
MRDIPKHILRFVILVLLQVVILNNVQLNGYLNPYMYVLFILLLPFEIPNWMLLFVAFFLGVSIDLFSSTLGMHASACVFMAFLRPYVLRLIALRDGYEMGTSPGIACFGVPWFLKYSLILICSHHLFLFYIEVFSFANFWETLGRAFLSVIFSFILIIISQFFMFKK